MGLTTDGTLQPDDKVSWKKPVVMLADELSVSCGDIVPLLAKANGLATVFGETTMGGGGNVEQVATLTNTQGALSISRGLNTVYDPTGAYPDAAFIEDTEARGLRDKILLVCCGEMGRTPKLNKNGGRDHWGKLSPLLLVGGGIPAGQVIGRSTRDGGEPDSDAVATPNLISTILHTVFDVGQLRLKPAFGEIARLGEMKPISAVS